jgi:hypothetical protein
VAASSFDLPSKVITIRHSCSLRTSH